MPKTPDKKNHTLELIARTVAEIKSDIVTIKGDMVTKGEFQQFKTEMAEFRVETAQNFKQVRTDIVDLHRITDRLELEH